jgi:hypothetical protein
MSVPRLRGCAASFTLVLLVVACGSGADKASTTRSPKATTGTVADTEFCKILTEASALLEPDPADAAPPPEQTKTEFDTIAALLAQAEVAAPTTLAADITAFAGAIDVYRGALADVGYNLGAIYSTPEGIALANDTSHALSPAVVRHMTGPCGISPNGGEYRTP